MFFVYILHSASLSKFYVGSTQHLEARLEEHNRGKSTFTRTGQPWRLIFNKVCVDRKEAVNLEMKIKKRGIRRFLEENNVDCH
jgi:putative endonuclease